jgi:hypothetical protein
LGSWNVLGRDKPFAGQATVLTDDKDGQWWKMLL